MEERYADIMSDTGMGGKTFSTQTSTVAKGTAFFADKRASTKDRVVATAGSTMAFENVGVRSRGIRPWERAKFEAQQRRERDQELYRQRNNPHRKLPVASSTPQVARPTQMNNFVGVPVQMPCCVPKQTQQEPTKIVVDAWDD